MDSNRRHELETNDLKDFLDNFKDFWEKHGNKVLVVLIVALLAYAGPKYYDNWQKGKANDAAEALNAATTPEALLAVADEHPMVRDEATRRAADLFFATARDAKIEDDADTADKAFKNAVSAYTAIAERGETLIYQIVGYEGLAKVAQEQGDAQQATAHYEKVIELAGDTYTLFAARAEQAIEGLPAVTNPVAFSPPEPATIAPTVPGQGGGDDDAGSPGDGIGPVLPGLDLPDVTSPVPGVPPADEGLGQPGEPPAPAE